MLIYYNSDCEIENKKLIEIFGKKISDTISALWV